MPAFLNTFVASPLYDLALGVTPPADLSLSAGAIARGMFYNRLGTNVTAGFNKSASPYLRSLGIFANIPGLASTDVYLGSVGGTAKGVLVELSAFAMTSAVPAIEVNNTAGSANITGSGFNNMVAGDEIMWRDNNGVLRRAEVDTVISNTSATLTSNTANTGMYAGNSTTRPGYVMAQSGGVGNLRVPIAALNRSQAFALPLVDYTLFNVGAYARTGSIMLQADLVGDMAFSTVDVAAGWAGKRLNINAVAEIEHTFPTTASI